MTREVSHIKEVKAEHELHWGALLSGSETDVFLPSFYAHVSHADESCSVFLLRYLVKQLESRENS